MKTDRDRDRDRGWCAVGAVEELSASPAGFERHPTSVFTCQPQSKVSPKQQPRPIHLHLLPKKLPHLNPPHTEFSNSLPYRGFIIQAPHCMVFFQ